MKTTKTKTTKSEIQSRPEHPINGETNNTVQPPAAQPPKSDRILPYVNFEQREKNRSLSTHQVLDLLQKWLPEQFNLAEIVGKWVWVTFPEPPAEKIRGQLSQFGFHWNNHRKCWQHPCGTLNSQLSTHHSESDPRAKYSTRTAAEFEPNPHEYNGPARTAE